MRSVRTKADPMRHRQGCTDRLPPGPQRYLDGLLARWGVAGAALRIGVTPYLVDSMAYGGAARAKSIRTVAEAIAILESQEARA